MIRSIVELEALFRSSSDNPWRVELGMEVSGRNAGWLVGWLVGWGGGINLLIV